MANAYNTWIPTAPVRLPIDTYFKTAMLGEERSRKYEEDIRGVFAEYGKIDPFSPDAKAALDAAFGTLKTNIKSIAGQNLNNPDAYRKFMAATLNPTVSRPITDVHRDALYAAKLQEDLREYQKKNPDINTSDHQEAINKTKLEEGNASNFNPNRFRSLPPLVEYFDANKRLEEGVARIAANPNSIEYKRIVGNITVEHKEKGVDIKRIREYVASQLASDPQVAAQINRNTRYKGFRVNPYNISDGLKQLGESYYETLANNYTTTNSELDALRGNKTDKQLAELRKKDKVFAATEINLLSSLEAFDKFKDASGTDFEKGMRLVNRMEKENMIEGFDQFAYLETSHKEEWDELYLAQRKANMQLAAKKALIDYNSKTMFDEAAKAFRVDYTGRDQLDVSPENRNEYLHHRVPELKGVILGKNGELIANEFNKDDYKLYEGKWYHNSDVTDPASFKGFINELKSKSPIKEGAVGYKNLEEAKGLSKTAAKDQIKKWYKDNSFDRGASINFDDPAALQSAINGIITYVSETESIYTPAIQDLSSTSPAAKASFIASMSTNKVYVDSPSGKRVLSKIEKDAATGIVSDYLGQENSSMVLTPVSIEGKSFRMVTVTGKAPGGQDSRFETKRYYVEGSDLEQLNAAPLNEVVKQTMLGGPPVRVLDNGDVFFKFKGSKGMGHGVVSGVSDTGAQKALMGIYFGNLKKVMDAGVDAETAESILHGVLNPDVQEKFVKDRLPISVKVKGKDVLIEVPVGAYTQPTLPGQKPTGPIFYTTGSVALPPDPKASYSGGVYEFKSGARLFNETLLRTQSFHNNPQRQLELSSIIGAKEKTRLATTNYLVDGWED